MSQMTQTSSLSDRKLVVVTSRFLPNQGGVEQHVAETVRLALAQGWEATIITGVDLQTAHRARSTWHWRPDDSVSSNSAVVIPLQYDSIKGIGLFQIWWQFLQVLPLFRKAHVIHVHDVMWWFLPIRILMPAKPVILTMHGWEGVFPIPAHFRFIKRLGAVFADRILAIGDYIGQYYGVRPDSISYGATTVPNALLSDSKMLQSRRQHRPVVAYVGRLAHDTGLPEMLTTIPLLTTLDWHFYGDGPLRRECERWGTVHGWSSIKPWLVDADCIVGSGYLSVWEALWAGKKVIVYAGNPLKVDYFLKAPFAPYITLVTNREECLHALTTVSKKPSATQAALRMKQLEAGQTLARAQQWSKISDLYHQWYLETQSVGLFQHIMQRWRHLCLTKQEIGMACARMVFFYVLVVLGLVVMSVVGLWLGVSSRQSTLSTQHQWLVMAQRSAEGASLLTFRIVTPVELLRKSSQAVVGLVDLLSHERLAESGGDQNDLIAKHSPGLILSSLFGDGASVVSTLCRYGGLLPQTSQQESLHSFCALLPQAQTEWQAMKILIEAIFDRQLELLVVMQNTQELRATGGFMGSYARIKFDQALLPDYEIGDIYEPDGQFQGYIAAPAGVDEYLSSGKGLRLPDANWFPDFPTSAQTILQYFAYGKRQGIDGVITVNLSVFERILAVLGPVSLPDYDLVVTADNFAQVARADRKHFFPGSQQKPHFLTALANQVRFRFETADTTEKLACIQIVLQALRQSDVQFYLIDEQLQAQLDVLGWSGRQKLPNTLGTAITRPLYFMSVESNVGINKANQAINRQILLDISEKAVLVQLKYQNNNSEAVIHGTQDEIINGMGYVNYQRIYVSPFLTVKQITIDGQVVPSWHEQLIQTDADFTLNQIGFVVPVPVGQSRTALIQLMFDSEQAQQGDAQHIDAVFIQKQSGLPTVEYTIQTATQVQSLQLGESQLIPLKK